MKSLSVKKGKTCNVRLNKQNQRYHLPSNHHVQLFQFQKKHPLAVGGIPIQQHQEEQEEKVNALLFLLRLSIDVQ